MRIEYRKQDYLALGKGLLMVLFGFLILSGCEERDSGDGTVINEIILPTDVVLNLFCEDVGVNDETCVLDDPENPYALVATLEFDVNNPDPNQPTKFDLLANIPPGPTGAKARFYLWATALARRQNGENQWYTARALYQLFDANSNPISKDEIVRAQALKAYRSVLDNFFGSVTIFAGVPVGLNEQTARDIFFPDVTGFRVLPPDDMGPIELFFEWGYRYDIENDLVFIIEF
ncbi:MAG: hypothetical protein GY783_11790 [Gammaproteobacteria bacterium]|nr:hypothetical protein [Gammaproteobacteria bacterium]